MKIKKKWIKILYLLINLHINSDDILMKQNFDSDKKDS